MSSPASDGSTLIDGGGAGLRFALPASARPDAPPAIDLPRVADARVVGAQTFRATDGAGGEVVLRAACVRASSDGWAPGVEDLVLGRATGLARGLVTEPIDAWDAGAITARGDVVTQTLAGRGRDHGAMKHALGFVGGSRDALVCTLVCVEPAGSDRCASIVDGAQPDGAFVAAPAPSATVRAILLAAEHPHAAASAGAFAAIAVVAVILARRPRPRP